MALICLMRTSCHQIALTCFGRTYLCEMYQSREKICMELIVTGSVQVLVTSRAIKLFGLMASKRFFEDPSSDLRFNKVSRGFLESGRVLKSSLLVNVRIRGEGGGINSGRKKRIYRGASSDNSCSMGPIIRAITFDSPCRRHLANVSVDISTRRTQAATHWKARDSRRPLVNHHKSNVVDDATQ
jgi:hypothetical protein